MSTNGAASSADQLFDWNFKLWEGRGVSIDVSAEEWRSFSEKAIWIGDKAGNNAVIKHIPDDMVNKFASLKGSRSLP
jgi:hypothetical protein